VREKGGKRGHTPFFPARARCGEGKRCVSPLFSNASRRIVEELVGTHLALLDRYCDRLAVRPKKASKRNRRRGLGKLRSLCVLVSLYELACFLMPIGALAAGSTDGGFLMQPPTTRGCQLSDPGADEIEVHADNFVVGPAPIQIDEVVVWAAYIFGNVPGVDNFHVRFLFDSAGLPGPDAAPQEVMVPAARADTGIDLEDGPGGISVDIYEFTLSLESPVLLSPGTYWIEVYNDVTNTRDVFCWIDGDPDPTNGLLGTASAGEAPGVNWIFAFGDDRAVGLAESVPVGLESFAVDK